MTDENTGASAAGLKWRGLHWIVAAAFFASLITGLIIYTPALSGLASGGWTRLVHRIAAVLLVGAPVAYGVLRPQAARQWLADLGLWRRKPPADGHVLNRWKRRHKLLISLGLALFVLTGALQWFLKGTVSPGAFHVSLFIHDILFFSAIIVVLYHGYFEVYWWLWRRQYCRRCEAAYCAGACPVGAIADDGGVIVRDPVRCNNCRLCMERCRREGLYRKSAPPA